ncbi:DNA cytosine methyltransferase [Neomoorella mulderi]|nr:DNA cytosine methyltransferase [Moorella mulderi]
MNDLRVLSFFSGAGGLDEGFRQIGFRIGFGFDIDPAAVLTHNFNYL